MKYVLFSVMCSLVFLYASAIPAFAQTANIYYVDCQAVDDSQNGLTPQTAWKTINKANNAPLRPGDSLLFKRGCTWPSGLRMDWEGTVMQPITVGSYGTGALPRLANSSSTMPNEVVVMTGDYQIIENIEVVTEPSSYTRTFENPADGGCMRYMDWRIGIRIGGAQDDQVISEGNIIRHVVVSGHAVGMHFRNNAQNTKVLYNDFHDNRALRQVTDNGDGTFTNPIGTMHIGLHGLGNEVGYNTFRSTEEDLETGFCSHTENSVELYAASDSLIHHNIAVGDRVFSEMGSNPGSNPPVISSNNLYAFNIHVTALNGVLNTNQNGPRFIVTRGIGHKNGPVVNTMVYNNTVYYPGVDGQGVTCQICAPDILTLRNNIFAVSNKGIFVGPDSTSEHQPVESNNIYWDTDGTFNANFTQNLSMSPTSRRVDPQFEQVQFSYPLNSASFRLQETSYGVNNGVMAASYTQDIVGTSVPQGATIDIGAFEFIEHDFLPGDANRDGRVSIVDLSRLLSRFGISPATWEDGDFNGDNTVSLADLALLLSHFGN